MEKSSKISNNTKQTKRCTLTTVSKITIVVVQIILAAFTACMFYQLTNLQREVTSLKKCCQKSDLEKLEETLPPIKVEELSRKDRQTGSVATSRESLDKLSYTSYIRWGRDTCSTGTSLIANSQGIISGFESASSNLLLMGSDIHCVPTPNDVDSGRQSSNSGVKLEALAFGLHGHSSAFTEDKNGHIHCAYCEVKGSDVMTITGLGDQRDCPHNWHYVYGGFLVSSNAAFGTTSSICMDANVKLVDSRLFPKSLWNMVAIQSGTSMPFSHSGKSVPCIVCSRRETEQTFPSTRHRPDGIIGATGFTEVRGIAGTDSPRRLVGQYSRNDRDGSN